MRKQQPKLENAKIFETPFITMLQTPPDDAIVLTQVPAYFFCTDHITHYKMYRFFSNKAVPYRILEVGIIPKNNYKEGDIYAY